MFSFSHINPKTRGNISPSVQKQKSTHRCDGANNRSQSQPASRDRRKFNQFPATAVTDSHLAGKFPCQRARSEFVEPPVRPSARPPPHRRTGVSGRARATKGAREKVCRELRNWKVGGWACCSHHWPFVRSCSRPRD